jgi:uncharacterized protein (TIGR04222 family)
MDRPWGISGPDFLLIYGICLVVPAVVGLVWTAIAARRRVRAAAAEDDPLPSPHHLGYLARGPVRAVETAISGLLAAGHLRVSTHGRISVTGRPEVEDPVERAVLELCRTTGGATAYQVIGTVHNSAAVTAIRRDLERRGLVVSDGGRRLALITVLGLSVLVLAFGMTRWITGLTLRQPIGYLSLLLVVALAGVGVSVLLVLRRSRFARTDAGNAALHRAVVWLPDAERTMVHEGLRSYPDAEIRQALVWAPRPAPGKRAAAMDGIPGIHTGAGSNGGVSGSGHSGSSGGGGGG